MNKPIKQRPTAFRFRHYCRAAYAAFNSLHREVTIGHMATYIADRQLHKAATVAIVGTLMLPVHAAAQSDDPLEERTLPTVEITLSADTLLGAPEPAAVLTAQDFNNTSVRSIGDLLMLLPNVDLRSRGVNDVQADLAMRGGTFDQMVLLLNGVNLTDAQTGHHTLDIPIDIAMVERVELLSPAQLLARGIAAFCGAVNIVVSEEYRDHLLAELSGGSHGSAKASLLATKTAGPWALTMAAAYNRSDGYMPNTDYRHGSLFVQAARHSATDDWHLQLGGQMKGFGSHAFYSTSYPDQYEATRTLTASAFNLHRWRRTRLETTLYGRLHGDRFELFRDGYAEAPAWYTGHNHHLSSIGGLRSRLAYSLGPGEALVGAELRREGIWSNVLGLADTTLPSPYDHAARRLSASLFAGYCLHHGRWTAEATLQGLYNSAFGLDYAAAADALYAAGRGLKLRASLSRTYRMPSFTDLYYQSVNQVANPDLGSESSLAADCGVDYTWRGLGLRASAFYRAGSSIIDWVRRQDEEVWYSMNHTAVDAAGLEASATLRLGRFTVAASYSYCNIAQDAGDWISGSALDYLRHKATAYLCAEPVDGLRFKVGGCYRYREGRYTAADGVPTAYGGVLLLDAGAEYTLRQVTLFVEGHNLADASYRDHGGVPQPGRTALAGLRLNLPQR